MISASCVLQLCFAALSIGFGRTETERVRRNDFVFNRPSKHPADAPDFLVDFRAAPFLADHHGPHGFQLEWAEFGCGNRTVEFRRDAQRILNHPLFAGGFTVLDLIRSGVLPIAQNHFVYGRAVLPTVDPLPGFRASGVSPVVSHSAMIRR